MHRGLSHLELNDLNLNDYHDLMFEQEIDLTVLAQLSEEQLSRIGVRTMGQRIRILNAARDASASSEVNQNQGDELSENSEEEGEEEEEGPASDEDEGEEEEGQDIGDDSEGEEEDVEEEPNNEDVEEDDDQEGDVHGEVGEESEEEEEQPFEYEIVTKTTNTGKKTHVIYVGENKYLSKGIKKNGQSYFYCNYVSVHHKCTSTFRVRYHDLQNPMDEIPEVETEPGPHRTTDGGIHVPDKIKRLREGFKEKVTEAIKADPLRPIKEIHEDVLNNALHTIEDPEERLEFCQQMPTFRQCERNEYRIRNRIIPPNPPTAETSPLMGSSPSTQRLASTPWYLMIKGLKIQTG